MATNIRFFLKSNYGDGIHFLPLKDKWSGLSTSSWNDLTTHSAECFYSKLSNFHAISWKLGLITAQDASMSTTIQYHDFHFPWGVSGIPLLYIYNYIYNYNICRVCLKGKETDTRKLGGFNHVGWPRSFFDATTLRRLPLVWLLSCWSKNPASWSHVQSDLCIYTVFYSHLHTVHKGAVPLSWSRLCHRTYQQNNRLVIVTLWSLCLIAGCVNSLNIPT